LSTSNKKREQSPSHLAPSISCSSLVFAQFPHLQSKMSLRTGARLAATARPSSPTIAGVTVPPLPPLNCPINRSLVLLLAIPLLIVHLCNSLQSISSSSSPSPPHNRPPLLVRRRSSHKHPLQHSRSSTHAPQTPHPQLSSAKRARCAFAYFRDFSGQGVQY
jgi:hypothetical protein